MKVKRFWTLCGVHLREFALRYERHPESMRGKSGLERRAVTPFPAHPAHPRIYFFCPADIGIKLFQPPASSSHVAADIGKNDF